jgi:nucleoside phosphorylase
MARQLPRDDYTVGWVCALPVELAAAREMLDEEHHDPERDPTENNENSYAFGSIGGHNVAIACLPANQISNNPTAVLATQLRVDFNAIRFVLLVGISGGFSTTKADIRLGDVEVDQSHQTFGGIVQYDSSEATLSGFERTRSLESLPHVLLRAVAKVRANQLRRRSQLYTYASKPERTAQFQRAKASQVAWDLEMRYAYGWCSIDRQEVQQPREREEEVAVHHGTAASSNQMIRSAAERDKVSAELGRVLCFEMEAVGLMNSFPCLVFRSIYDCADSYKHKLWQPYAAAAAACAKEVLSVIPPAEVAKTNTGDEAIRFLYGQ